MAASPARVGGCGPIRVAICDDSAVIRAAIRRCLAGDPGVTLVGQAANGQEALDLVSEAPGRVEVLVLDIEMPVLDGLAALPRLLRADPGLRVVIASTLSTPGGAATLEALRLGAADYVPKPVAAQVSGDGSFRSELLAKIRALGRGRAADPLGPAARLPTRPLPSRLRPALLAVGSSTGGPQALCAFLLELRRAAGPGGLRVPVVMTQHMPPTFTPLLAQQVERMSGIACTEAQDGAPLLAGRAYLAPGGRHLLVRHGAGGLVAQLDDGAPENFCRPSVDPMLRSASQAARGQVLLIMLTGMGQDGLAGTRTLVAEGGAALAQDEASSVVWGMPGAIARAGLCHAVLPISALARKAARLLAGPA